MIFGVNTSPMAGRDGQYVTSRQLRDRLDRCFDAIIEGRAEICALHPVQPIVESARLAFVDMVGRKRRSNRACRAL